jgi:hypothetical protein
VVKRDLTINTKHTVSRLRVFNGDKSNNLVVGDSHGELKIVSILEGKKSSHKEISSARSPSRRSR